MIAALVNDLVAGNTDEQHLSMHIMAMQAKQLDLSAQLEEASFDAASAMPRVLRELERIRDDADELRAKLTTIEVALGTVEASTEKSVALLAELDRVKKNLESCAAVLREADAFLALSRRLESAQLHEFQSVISQIRHVRASPQLALLQAVPEFRDMTGRLAQYERRLESHLRPKFVAALRANDAAAASELAAVYRDIGQSAAMRTSYFDTRLEELQTFWNAYQPPLTAWLPLFYARLQRVVVAETEWCKLLFGQAQKRELEAHLLAHFDGALAGRLQSCTLPDVVDLHRIALSPAPFAYHVERYGQLERDNLLRDTASDAFVAADAAVERCFSLTAFAQYAGLLDALEAHFCARLSNAAADAEDAFHRLASAKALQRKVATFDSKLRARLLAHIAIERFQDDAALPVVPRTAQHVSVMVETARSAVFESLFGTIRTALADYARLPVWLKMGGDVDPDLPKMRPDPTAAVAGVVEHLFALLHHLESLNSVADQEYWINLVVKAAVDLFVKQVSAIPRLSASGREQLSIDVSAFANLLSALGVASGSLASLKL